MMKNIAVLVSGGGTNLQALIDAQFPIGGGFGLFVFFGKLNAGVRGR